MLLKGSPNYSHRNTNISLHKDKRKLLNQSILHIQHQNHNIQKAKDKAEQGQHFLRDVTHADHI